MINIEKEELFVMNYRKFDELVNNFYGCDKLSDFPVDIESLNDVCYEYNIEKTNELHKDEAKDLKALIAYRKGEISHEEACEQSSYGNFPRVWPDRYLLDMAIKGHIPYGKYLVRVSW